MTRPRATILVVDDDPSTRILLRVILSKRGYTVAEAENGLLGYESAKRLRPDVVLIDWSMPVLDGRQTVERLKADPQTRDIPVVMLTSHSHPEETRDVFAAGAQDVVAKPFDTRDLVERLERQLRA